ncbi:hypothetical protein HK102_005268, partial [Quaeritorhiza haematococci]
MTDPATVVTTIEEPIMAYPQRSSSLNNLDDPDGGGTGVVALGALGGNNNVNDLAAVAAGYVMNRTAHTRKESLDDESARWKMTLERVIKSIVSIRFIITRNFDTWHMGSYTA